DVARAGMHAERDSLADRILTWKSYCSEPRVDNANVRRRHGVADPECASGHERDAEHLEEVNPDGIVGLSLIPARVKRFALRQDGRLQLVARQIRPGRRLPRADEGTGVYADPP